MSSADDVVRGVFRSEFGDRRYRLFVPSDPGAPLLVMLHGCTQDAEDFAAGTRMDAVAREKGLMVLYPEQSATDHPQACWRWFDPDHQRREAGEPALLAGMVREMVEEHGADADRVFVAGISAGGGMALTLAVTHPELFAGVAVHSGVPYAASPPSTPVEVMAGGGPDVGGLVRRLRRALGTRGGPPPLILFHGSDDEVVRVANARRIAASWAVARSSDGGPDPDGRDEDRAAAEGVHQLPPPALEEEGLSPGGLAYTRSRWTWSRGGLPMEMWIVHGLGHAWSGGDPDGSYTDPRGPDASRAIVEFLLRREEP